jgi:hypothetical protein
MHASCSPAPIVRKGEKKTQHFTATGFYTREKLLHRHFSSGDSRSRSSSSQKPAVQQKISCPPLFPLSAHVPRSQRFGVPTTIAEPASLPYPTYYACSPAHLIQHSIIHPSIFHTLSSSTSPLRRTSLLFFLSEEVNLSSFRHLLLLLLLLLFDCTTSTLEPRLDFRIAGLAFGL